MVRYQKIKLWEKKRLRKPNEWKKIKRKITNAMKNIWLNLNSMHPLFGEIKTSRERNELYIRKTETKIKAGDIAYVERLRRTSISISSLVRWWTWCCRCWWSVRNIYTYINRWIDEMKRVITKKKSITSNFFLCFSSFCYYYCYS